MDVDRMGLDRADRNFLFTLIDKFGGGPAGLDTMAAAIGEDPGTLEDLVEPYLLQNGLINRTPRGRMATQEAYRHLGIPMQQRSNGENTGMEMNMAQKTEAQVTIGGKTYTLSGYESEEYILKVAEYLNGKIDELTADSEYAKIPTDMRQLLLNLNIADDYFKMKAQNEELAALIDKKENELYDIKHDLVAAQMKLGQAVDGGKSGKLSAK